MYIPVHFLASSFSDEKLDTVWNHWLPVSTAMFLIYPPAINAPKDGRGIGQKQVLEQNLSSTDVHGRTSVERYTDVQQWKMVQMVSQSQFFRDFYLFCLMRLPFSRKNVRNFKSTYPDASVGAQCSTFRTVCSIRWLQSALIPFVTTQASGY